ncbi:TPA: hypothetical protein N0F65_001776 [Lagenidium giganteum]|uniref:HAT C-terminal dimerisation domain-containing protein n=1 Tax=Lagenidium giganteum TaxID=4803 RepID=A0AAV2Z2E7_9STRA|nr:TPA: hypothetical protein N0F65_001776 [Lagenidium giganteum]
MFQAALRRPHPLLDESSSHRFEPILGDSLAAKIYGVIGGRIRWTLLYVFRRLVLATSVSDDQDASTSYRRLRLDLKQWLLYGVPNMRKTLDNYGGIPVNSEYTRCKGMLPTLSQLEFRILAIEGNTASCERLFSSLDAIHTKYRNATGATTVRKLATVKTRLHQERGHDAAARKCHRILCPSELPLYHQLNVGAQPTPDVDEHEVPEETEEDRIFA